MSELFIPRDPVDVLIERFKSGSHDLALQLMDEDIIISVGNMSGPNDIEALGIGYEKLPSEASLDASARQWIAGQLSRLRGRTYTRQPLLRSRWLNEAAKNLRSASSRMTYPALRKRGR